MSRLMGRNANVRSKCKLLQRGGRVTSTYEDGYGVREWVIAQEKFINKMTVRHAGHQRYRRGK